MKYNIYLIPILQKNQKKILIVELLEKEILRHHEGKSQQEVFLKVVVPEDELNHQAGRILEKNLMKESCQELIKKDHQETLNHLIRMVINQKDMQVKKLIQKDHSKNYL